MSNHTVVSLKQPAEFECDPLTSLLKQGAKELIAKAVEAELNHLLSEYAEQYLPDGRQAIIRNGYLPERTVQTGLGAVEIKIPKVRDRSGSGIKFNSNLIPPYLKRSGNVEEFIPYLYLRGISTNDFQSCLSTLFGEQTKGLSPSTISMLKSKWEDEYGYWIKRDLSHKRYVYIWADGIYSKVRSDPDKQCMLVIIGVLDNGKKELLAIDDGYRESEQSWSEILIDLKARGLSSAPELAVADGALGFWSALAKLYPQTKQQRCWVHKTANVLGKVPKSMQPKIKSALQDIWMADTKDDAYKAFEKAIKQYEAKYPKAMSCLQKNKEEMLAFYDFPASHWQHIRSTNVIESMFATIRLRTNKIKSCGSRKTNLAMAFKLAQSAEARWRKIRGFRLLADVIQGVKFQDGVKVEQQNQDFRMVA